MAAIHKQHWTPEEYIAYERASEEKHIFLNGEIFSMSGASRKHNLIGFNLTTILGNRLKGQPCEAYANDMRVKISPKQYTYPDISVVCAEPEFEDIELDTLLNPTLIIEVLSPSTEQYDRGKKFESYRSLDSLQEYVLVAQDRAHIERYVRQDGGNWLFSEVNGLEASLDLASIQCTLTLADVYDKVTFDAEPSTFE